MLKNSALLESFEKDLVRNRPADFRQNVLVFESMYNEARALGIFPLKNPLDGIETDLHLARVLNARRDSREDREIAG